VSLRRRSTCSRKGGALPGPSNPIVYFKWLYYRFKLILAQDGKKRDLIESLSRKAYEHFARGITGEEKEGDFIACHGGCASCCTIRVTATAPEIFSLARQIKAFPSDIASELKQRIVAAEQSTRNQSPAQRMASSLKCPLIKNELCISYSVRPLACRGHASYDKDACREALAGRSCEVPISALQLTVRSLVQNALQSALRDAHLAWGCYELNQALTIALTQTSCERAWMAGDDVFASALVTEVSLHEMAETFDALKTMPA